MRGSLRTSVFVLLAAWVPACSTADGTDGVGDQAAADSGTGGSSGTGGGHATGGGAGKGGAIGNAGAPGAGGVPGTGGSPGTGGVSGTGGSSGTDGGGTGGTQTVGKCDALGAVGQWENITPPYITAHPTYTGALVALVNSQNPAIVYVTSDSDGVFKSTDCGATWLKVNTGRNGTQLDSGRIWAAVIDPVAPDTIYAITGYGAGGLWKTTNGGTDWDQMLPSGSDVATTAGGFVERVVMDPTNHLHLLINFHQNCSGGHTPVCFGESTDGGATWKLLDFPASLSSGWGEGSGLMILKPDVWLYEQWHLFHTSDHGATWTNLTSSGITPCFNGNTSTPPQTPDGTYYLGASPGIWHSTDGATWSAIANSGVGNVCAVIGDGSRLYTGTIQNPETVSFATYADPTHWSTLATPGLPSQPAENLYTFAVDPAHHILYSTIQSAGFWRVVTQ